MHDRYIIDVLVTPPLSIQTTDIENISNLLSISKEKENIVSAIVFSSELNKAIEFEQKLNELLGLKKQLEEAGAEVELK